MFSFTFCKKMTGFCSFFSTVCGHNHREGWNVCAMGCDSRRANNRFAEPLRTGNSCVALHCNRGCFARRVLA